MLWLTGNPNLDFRKPHNYQTKAMPSKQDQFGIHNVVFHIGSTMRLFLVIVTSQTVSHLSVSFFAVSYVTNDIGSPTMSVLTLNHLMSFV